MAADNNYNEILEEVCEKLNNIDSIKELDMLDIKNSVETIESLITDSQVKLNFQEIKEKLENIAFQVDNCNETLLKDLYNDINQLKERSKDFSAHLENIQNVQNLSLTNAEFEEFQKQQLDLALKTNENIFSELKQLKEISRPVDNTEKIKNLDDKLNILHKSLSIYAEQLVSKIDASSPNLDELGALMTDINNISNKNIKETNNLIKELESNFNKFKDKEFAEQITKLSEIYDSLNIIHAWIEQVGLLNKSIENVYARLGENIDFDDIAEKVDIIYDNITALNDWSMKIDSIEGNMSEFQTKIASLSSLSNDAQNISKTLNNIKNKLNTTFSEELDFDDISGKMDIIYENLTALNTWAEKIDNISDDVSLLKTNYKKDNINSKIDDIAEKVSFINSSIEKDNIHSKIDNISEKVSSINNSLEKDNINSKINDISEKVSYINDSIEKDNLHSKIDNISEKISSINDSLEKDDIHSKIDNISEKVSSINNAFEENVISSKIDLIYDNINLLNEWVKKIDNITTKSEELDNKFTDAKDKFSTKIDEISKVLFDTSKNVIDIPDIKNNLDKLSNELYLITRSTKNDTESYIYTLLDIESDFLKLHKILEEKTQTTSDVVNSLKERFEELNDDISSISKRTNKLILSADDANKEFKIHLESFKNIIVDFETQKQAFDPETKFKNISDNLSVLNTLLHNSANTSKNLNDAFIYLAEWIDATGGILNSMINDITFVKTQSAKIETFDRIINQIADTRKQISDTIKSSIAGNKKEILEEISQFKSKVAQAIKSSSELVDGRISNEVSGEIKELKVQINTSIKNISELSEALENHRNEDISEIKSLLTGIIVQLNTALTPDIDSLNERIDKLSEENQDKFSQLEVLLKEKIEIQAKQINALEDKVDNLYGKIDKLIETIGESNKNDEIKDILNYITTQITTANESILNRPDNKEEFNKLSSAQAATITALREVITGQKNIADKISSFDSNVNKIVSYIEED